MNFGESVDTETVGKMLRFTFEDFLEVKPSIDRPTYTRCMEYLKRMGKGFLSTHYEPAKNFPNGRLYCKTGIQMLPGVFRNALFADTTTDVDMQNAHPTIIKTLCDRYKIKCPMLTSYVDNRAEFIETMKRHGIEDPKVTYLKCIFDDQPCQIEAMAPYDDELKNIQARLPGIPELVRLLPRNDKRSKNIQGSNLACLCQVFENELLQRAVTYVTKQGLSVTVLMFDGFMLSGDYYGADALLEGLNEVCEDFGIKWAFKRHVNLFHDKLEVTTALPLHERDAGNVILKLHPHWACVGNALYAFDWDTGLWSQNVNVHNAILLRHHDDLGAFGDSTVCFPGILRCIKAAKVAEGQRWVTMMENTSLGKLLFTNGWYDYETNEFHTEFTPEILFHFRCDYPFTRCEDTELMETIKQTWFYDQHGTVLGDYIMQFYGYGLAGKQQKRFLIGLGIGNSGKSWFITMMNKVCDGYAASFSGNCLKASESTADESLKLSWVAPIMYKRLIFSSEITLNRKPLDGNLCKSLSGGDRIQSREIYQTSRDMLPHFCMSILANALPEFHPVDQPLLNRVTAVPFNKLYSDKPALGELKRDPTLLAKLETDEYRCAVMTVLMNAYHMPPVDPPASMLDDAVEFTKFESLEDILTGLYGFTASSIGKPVNVLTDIMPKLARINRYDTSASVADVLRKVFSARMGFSIPRRKVHGKIFYHCLIDLERSHDDTGGMTYEPPSDLQAHYDANHHSFLVLMEEVHMYQNQDGFICRVGKRLDANGVEYRPLKKTKCDLVPNVPNENA
jgi:hypothetical protein